MSKTTQQETARKTALATKKVAEGTLKKKEKKLKSTKIYAPQDGLVIYPKRDRWGRNTQIEEGAMVHKRQTIVTIPDVSKMKIDVKIHEAILPQIKIGQQVHVTLDLVPDKHFSGTVSKIAILPEQVSHWEKNNAKVYSTEISISEDMSEFKPGISAKGEIIIAELKNVMSIPIQAVTTFKGKQVCYLKGQEEPVEVEIGLFNTSFIEIKSGLSEGQEVRLDPPLDSSIDSEDEINEETHSQEEGSKTPA